jgi:hypothetical protein
MFDKCLEHVKYILTSFYEIFTKVIGEEFRNNYFSMSSS